MLSRGLVLVAFTLGIAQVAVPMVAAQESQGAQATSDVPAAAPDPAVILAATREALGGATRLAELRSFVASGRTERVQGNNLVPVEVEIICELPDRCVRREEVPAQATGLRTTGFDGARLIQRPSRGGPPGGLPPNIAADRLNSTKRDFVRLWLGMFADSTATFPLTFAYLGEAEAPEGSAHVLQAVGPSDFAAQLFLLSESGLPVMLRWEEQVMGKPVEARLYFADYRAVGELQLPFRMRRANGADTVEETTFDRFRLNVSIDAETFGDEP